MENFHQPTTLLRKKNVYMLSVHWIHVHLLQFMSYELDHIWFGSMANLRREKKMSREFKKNWQDEEHRNRLPCKSVVVLTLDRLSLYIL